MCIALAASWYFVVGVAMFVHRVEVDTDGPVSVTGRGMVRLQRCGASAGQSEGKKAHK